MMTTKEAVKFLGISTRTLSRLINDGSLTVIKKEGKNYYKKSDLRAIMSSVEGKKVHRPTKEVDSLDLTPPETAAVNMEKGQEFFSDLQEKYFPDTEVNAAQESALQSVVMAMLAKYHMESRMAKDISSEAYPQLYYLLLRNESLAIKNLKASHNV